MEVTSSAEGASLQHETCGQSDGFVETAVPSIDAVNPSPSNDVEEIQSVVDNLCTSVLSEMEETAEGELANTAEVALGSGADTAATNSDEQQTQQRQQTVAADESAKRRFGIPDRVEIGISCKEFQQLLHSINAKMANKRKSDGKSSSHSRRTDEAQSAEGIGAKKPRRNSESTERRTERKRRRRDERQRSPNDKVRSDAVAPHKRNFNRIIQCAFCELIVRPERFGGRESSFCSAECISRRVDLVRKCGVKESERILLIDTKGNIYNGPSSPTIDTLEVFINQNPSYNPLIDDARLAAATQQVFDPGQQRKIDLMRMDVRKAIENGLQRRCKAANMCFSMKRYKDLGHDIERALFTIHQDVNVKYRKWFKGFMTVLNDDKNAYFKEVMRDKVSVKRLVMLGEEQMRVAMPVTAVLAAADSTSADNANGASTSSSSALFTRQESKKSAVHAKSAVDEILGERQSDTTLLHTTHLFDANCQICKGEQAKKLAMRRRAEERESMLDQQLKLQQLKQSTPHFPNLDPSIHTDNLDPSIISALSSISAPVLPPSRHHRTATTSSDFDPPLASVSGGDITPLMDTATGVTVGSNNNNGASGYDAEHDPLGLNNVQVGDPLMGDEDNDGVHQQRHPEPNVDEMEDDAFRFDGGAFDENDYGEEEATNAEQLENADGKENVSNITPNRSSADVRRSPAAVQQQQQHFDGTPTSFSNGGFAGPADENVVGSCSARPRSTSRDTMDRHFDRISGPRTPPLCFASNIGNLPSENIAVVPPPDAGNVLRCPSDAIEEAPHEAQQQFLGETALSAADPWKTGSLLVWHGLFVATKLCFFNCTCTAVSGGLAVFKAGREMMPPYSAPATGSSDGGRVHLIGLSDSRGVWQYVMQLRNSEHKQVCLLVVNRPKEHPDFVNYMECFTFYNQGTQVGVLDFDQHPTIKDGYVFTLSPGEPLPSVLLPLDGVGLPEWTQHNGCIMLMIVRRMDHEDRQWRKRRLLGMGVGDESWRQQHQQQMMPVDIPVTPPPPQLVGRAVGVERAARVLSDPRLDYELTARMGSRLYRFSRLCKSMPMLFNQIFAEISMDNGEECNDENREE